MKLSHLPFNPFTTFSALATALLLAVASPGVATNNDEDLAGEGGHTPTAGVQIIVDASRTMAGSLADGTERMDAVRQATGAWLDHLKSSDETVEVSLRAFGNGSRRRIQDCEDTELLAKPTLATEVGKDWTGALLGLPPTGFSPISRALEIGTRDLARRTTEERAIVLIADGRDSCGVDPCHTARILRASHPTLRIHTIALDPDAATGAQLACIADVTGGIHLHADSVEAVTAALTQTANAEPNPPVAFTGGSGVLTLDRATIPGHEVRDTRTGTIIGSLSSGRRSKNLPAGVYNIAMGPLWWQSVRIAPGQQTILRPGILSVRGASVRGHRVRDSETGVLAGGVSTIKSSIPLIPGTYDITFGQALWRGVRVEAGHETVLRPPRLEYRGVPARGVQVRDAAGREVGTLTPGYWRLAVPPGSYVVDLAGGPATFDLERGQVIDLGQHDR